MADRVDVVVVGAGLVGAATAWQAAARGLTVRVLEQDVPASPMGSSHGSARIFRRAYPELDYVRLTGEAWELFRELESQTGLPILRVTGGLTFGSTRPPQEIAEAMDLAGVPHEVIPAPEAEKRWPGMRFHGDVDYHSEAGTIDAEYAVEGMLDLAKARGATVTCDTRVTAIAPDGDGAVVTAGDARIAARVVVVAAGAWMAEVAGGLADLPPLAVTEHRVFHFPRLDPDVVWPVTLHRDALDIYHLPGGRDGGPGDARKVAEHRGTPTTTSTRTGIVDPASREMIVGYVREWLPGLDPTPFGEGTCLYTRTPTEDFLVDRSGHVVIAAACSGHGAKLAPVVGRMTADLIQGRRQAIPRFSWAAHAAG